MNEIFFTSDHHFFHKNIINYSNRPYNTLEEMQYDYINKWNTVVSKGSIVYYLGDFCGQRSTKINIIENTLSSLNGQKHLILGNHDCKNTKRAKGWSWVGDYKYITVNNQKIVLFHYAIRSWRSIHRGSWHLYGHSHGTLEDIGGLCCDVGVDVWDGYPVSFDEIKSFMSKRKPLYVDHHRR